MYLKKIVMYHAFLVRVNYTSQLEADAVSILTM